MFVNILPWERVPVPARLYRPDNFSRQLLHLSDRVHPKKPRVFQKKLRNAPHEKCIVPFCFRETSRRSTQIRGNAVELQLETH